MEIINYYILKAISVFGGTQFLGVATEGKAQVVFTGLLAAALFAGAFIYFYRRYFTDTELRRGMWFIIGVVLLVSFTKYALFYFAKGYVADRMIFYALPSPKAEGLWWLALATVIFVIFVGLRERIEKLSAAKFLLALWAAFVILGVSVAGIREGLYGIYEPFTRTHWEYAGDLPLVNGVSDFLHNYTLLNPALSSHGSTHPPGYVLLLYILQKLFSIDLLGLAILVGSIGGLTILPLYFLWRRFADEAEVRRGLQLFIFLPSILIFSFTSMEAALMFAVWLSIAVLYIGWEKSAAAAFMGGVLAGVALMFNFLFLLLAPLYLFLAYEVYAEGRARLAPLFARVILSLVGFGMFFAALYWLTGYSIVDNFLVARGANREIVRSNFESIAFFFTYLFMNIFAFSYYLGVQNMIKLVYGIRDIFRARPRIYAVGFALVAIFLAVGIFQGEVERIWLFMAPLFVLSLGRLFRQVSGRDFSAAQALLFFQVVVTQILFYTYW